MNLELTKEKDNVFSSNVCGSYNKNSIFGGILISQSLMAAYKTVDQTMNLHSLQLYFINKGDNKQTVRYLVDPIMNGRSFAKRSVSMKQNEKLVSKMNLSFKTDEPPSVFSYNPKIPSVIHHDQIPLLSDVVHQKLKSQVQEKELLRKLTRYSEWSVDFPIDLKSVDSELQLSTKVNPSNKVFTWFKLRDSNLMDFGPKYARHVFLGFVSDFFLLTPIVTMHCFQTFGQILSLDHVMWFHCNKFNPNEWLLIEAECNVANNGTTLNTGRVWSESGTLLTTIMQQGIIRPPVEKK